MSRQILYSAIVHGQDVVVEYDKVPGAARSLAMVVLDRVDATEDKKQSFLHEDLSVHYVTKSGIASAPDGLVFIVVTNKDAERRVPFLYLLHLERVFEQKYASSVDETVDELKHSGTLLPELKQLVETAERGEHDSTGLAKAEIEQVKNVMVENVERILERGERINLLVSKTDRMNNNALAFRRRTVAVRRTMWWKNVKLSVLLVLVMLVVVYLCLGFVCGLPGFEQCFGPYHSGPQV